MRYGVLRMYRMLDDAPCYVGHFSDEVAAIRYAWNNFRFEMERGWIYADFTYSYQRLERNETG